MKPSTPDRRGSAHGTGRGRPQAARRGTAGAGSRTRRETPGAARSAGGHRGRGQAEVPPPEDGRRPEAYTQVRLRSPDGPLRARVDPLRDLPSVRRDDRTARGLPPRSRISRAFADLGWRAYAIPLLVIATMLVLVDLARSDPDAPTGLPAANSSSAAPSPKQTVFVDGPASGTPAPNLPADALPGGAPFAQQGNGQFDIVPGTSQIYGSAGPLSTFTVEIEEGVKADPKAFASAVEKILSDPRGWTHGGARRFQRVDAGNPDFRITLTTPLTVRKPNICGYEIKVETSCFNGQINRVVINLARWVRGAPSYQGHLDTYRDYAVTHETGHALGHGHQSCPATGALAPPMMQQTLGLTSANGKTCKANPWPFPSGDKEITGPPTQESPH